MIKWGSGWKWGAWTWGQDDAPTYVAREENLSLQSDQPRAYRLRRPNAGRLMRRPASGNVARRPDQ